MPATAERHNHLEQLRNKAELQLQAGTTKAGSQWSLSVDALRMLHSLSSHSDSAEDALKLLHELQVHQVELDLQNEEITVREQALSDDLAFYRELFDAAPVGYFLIDLEGKIIRGNRAGAALLGVECDELEQQPIDVFVRADSRPRLFGLLQRVLENGASDACVADTGGCARGTRQLTFQASIPPSGREHVLLVCSPCIDVKQARSNCLHYGSLSP